MPDESKRRRFDRVAMPHLDAAYALARWLLHDRDEAEDAVQDAMLKAFKYLDSCRDETARPWLLRIVRNACFDTLRAKAHADLDLDEAAIDACEEDAFTAPPADPERLLMRKDEQTLLDGLIAALPPEFREVIVLKEMEDLSYKDIAEVAGIPVGTVMSRLSRARAALAREWKRQNG